MSPTSRITSVFAVALLTLALAGCGEKKTGSEIPVVTISDSEATAAAEGSGDGASGGACPAVNQEGLDIFSSDQVLVAPMDGAVYGDGTPISWTFAGPIEGTPDVSMYYINDDGDAIAMTGIFLDDMGDNTWGSDLSVFWSDANEQPGLMVLGLTHDAGIAEDGSLTGTHEEVGIYCVTYKVSE